MYFLKVKKYEAAHGLINIRKMIFAKCDFPR